MKKIIAVILGLIIVSETVGVFQSIIYYSKGSYDLVYVITTILTQIVLTGVFVLLEVKTIKAIKNNKKLWVKR